MNVRTRAAAPAVGRRARRGAGRGAALLLAAVAVLVGLAPGAAPAEQVGEYELKAAFLYNFAKFVDWPPAAFHDTGDAFVVGILGDVPSEAVLERTLAGKAVQDRQLVVRHFDDVGAVDRCHVLFIAAGSEWVLPALRRRAAREHILLVGESPEVVERGGMIALDMEGRHLRFEVNLDAAERAGLKISSQLLKLARRVIKQSG